MPLLMIACVRQTSGCRCQGQQSAEKQLSIRCLPQTLTLHLKRFEHSSLQVSGLVPKQHASPSALMPLASSSNTCAASVA